MDKSAEEEDGWLRGRAGREGANFELSFRRLLTSPLLLPSRRPHTHPTTFASSRAMPSSPPNSLPRSISESSFLLVSPLPSFPDLFTPSKWLYLLPLLALADLVTNVVLGVLIAGREEMGLVAWGVFRAALVGWIGWGRGVKRGGSGGGGWIAGELEYFFCHTP